MQAVDVDVMGARTTMLAVSRFSLWLLCFLVMVPAQASWPVQDGSDRELPSLAPLVEQVGPAVVNISVSATRVVENPLLNDPFFRRFFEGAPGAEPRQRKTQSAGSGVIIDAEEGIVVTNYHVVDGADEIEVTLSDDRSFKAELVGADPEVDIAVLRIEASELTAATLADSDQLRTGDFVMAIGNPFGLGQTVTTGVVSALGRMGLGIEGYENFIQTDASINPGNSGGALMNLKGEVVGINTAIIAPAGGNIGIGFAIPVNMARSSIEQILEHGEVQRGQLGVVIQDLTRELAEAFGLEADVRGVVIAEVQPGSAADRAGLREGDVVVDIDGQPVVSAARLRNEVGVRRIGETVRLTVLRDGKRRTIKAKIAERPGAGRGEQELHRLLSGARFVDGEDGRGVVVAGLQQGSPAARSGLRPGDVIVSVNRAPISSVRELSQALERGGERLLLRVLRGNSAFYLVLQ